MLVIRYRATAKVDGRNVRFENCTSEAAARAILATYTTAGYTVTDERVVDYVAARVQGRAG